MWIVFSLLSRFLWASCNTMDQVYSRRFKTEKTMAAMVLGCICEIPSAIAAFFLSDTLHQVDGLLVIWAGCAIITYLFALGPYFYALQKEPAYNITPFMELTPIFLILIAVVALQEKLTAFQMAGAAIIIACGFVFSWDFRQSRLKTGVIIPVAISCVAFALSQFSVRIASDHGDIWAVTFFLMTGNSLFGLAAFALLPKVRGSIIEAVRASRGSTALLGFFSSTCGFLGIAAITTAFVMAPSTGHVAALSGTQPFFAFILAFIMGRLLPKYYERLSMNAEMRVKLLLICLIGAGVYLLTL